MGGVGVGERRALSTCYFSACFFPYNDADTWLSIFLSAFSWNAMKDQLLCLTQGSERLRDLHKGPQWKWECRIQPVSFSLSHTIFFLSSRSCGPVGQMGPLYSENTVPFHLPSGEAASPAWE